MSTKNELIKSVLNVARLNLGLGEDPDGSNHNKITEWYNKNVEKIGDGPWCEMKHAWVCEMAGVESLQKPRAFTPYAAGDAQKGVYGMSWHWGTKGMKVGDKVYFDWQRGVKNAATVDHTGRVEHIFEDGTFHCLEGNTGSAEGGRLLRQHRDSKYVMGYVRYDWDRLVDIPSPSPNPTPTRKPPELLVDGNLGTKTIKAWQRIMKTPIDGVISEPKSDLVVAVQRKLKRTVNHRQPVNGKGINQNGQYSPTVASLQNYLNSPVDGIIDVENSQVIKALQRRLNEGRF